MVDVTDETFEREVLERSVEVPVVVDLWADWCGPCRSLGPILERVVGETDGKVALAKIDVDANPRAAATFQVRSIPAVYAVKDRRVVDSFIGALPEPAVRQFVAGLAPPETEADRLAALGDEASLRQALELGPNHPTAVVALAELLVGQDQGEEALALLARVGEPPSADGDVEARLEGLLDRVKHDDDARRQYVDLLEVLGPDDPRTAHYRKALTARLF